MISPSGLVGASASVGAPSVQSCATGLNAVLQPPVSATADKVFFRDGDTKIRYLTPTGQTGDATTVPGGPKTVSFFSVSPDDQRIAVLVEDLSPAPTISLRLYVEDLNGGAHHVDIYSATTSKGSQATTLWPMGWHQGALALALVGACGLDSTRVHPYQWHLSSATTADRLTNIPGADCILSYWPSPAGVACVHAGGPDTSFADIYDWTGKLTANVQIASIDYQSSVSPSGRQAFFVTPLTIGEPVSVTDIYTALQTRSGRVILAGHTACVWIDEGHLLAPDAVIDVGRAASGSGGDVIILPASGVCAGRYPGGL